MKKVRDHYFHRAKQEGYRARSVYKLQEADSKFGFLRAGARVLDLGAAPGSWSQYAARKVGRKGKVIAVDLQRIDNIGPNVLLLQADISSVDSQKLLAAAGSDCFDVVLSDMAPKTTGNRGVDHLRSIGLAEMALDFALRLLPQGGGFFYCKVFEGGELAAFRERCRECFKTVRTFKPKSSRDESVEIFLMCSGLRA